MKLRYDCIDYEMFDNGILPPRVYCKSRKPVLLNTAKKAFTLLMLLRASEKKHRNWVVGCNENGWHFVYEAPLTA